MAEWSGLLYPWSQVLGGSGFKGEQKASRIRDSGYMFYREHPEIFFLFQTNKETGKPFQKSAFFMKKSPGPLVKTKLSSWSFFHRSCD